jgi:dTDP-glucose 4,6-dehydratase
VTTLRSALVTGGAGFVGSHLCDRLLERGVRVTALDSMVSGAPDNLAEALQHPAFSLVEGGIDDTASLEQVPDGVDVVLHLASPASPVAYQEHPVETLRAGSVGTLNALEVAERTGARFVLASTSEVYGDPAVHPQPESYWGNVNPVGERAMYDEAKRFSEAATSTWRRSHGTDTGIVRIFNTYGPRMARDDGRVVPAFICQALAGKPLTVHGDGSQSRSLCYVDDTVEALLLMADSDEPGPVNIGNPHEVTVLEIAQAIASAADREGEPEIRFEPRPADDPERRCPDISAAQELLGWKPQVDLTDGLARTVRWFRDGTR